MNVAIQNSINSLVAKIPVLGTIFSLGNSVTNGLNSAIGLPSLAQLQSNVTSSVENKIIAQNVNCPYLAFVWTGDDCNAFIGNTQPNMVLPLTGVVYAGQKSGSKITNAWTRADQGKCFYYPYIYQFCQGNNNSFDQTSFENWFNNAGSGTPPNNSTNNPVTAGNNRVSNNGSNNAVVNNAVNLGNSYSQYLSTYPVPMLTQDQWNTAKGITAQPVTNQTNNPLPPQQNRGSNIINAAGTPIVNNANSITPITTASLSNNYYYYIIAAILILILLIKRK